MIAVLLASFLASTHASASFLIHTNRTAWETAVGPVSGTEDFNGFATDTSFINTTVPLNNMTIIGTSGSNGTNTQKIDAPPVQYSSYTYDGSSAVLGDLDGSSEYIRIDFLTPVTAWGVNTLGMSNGTRNTLITAFDADNNGLGTIVTDSSGSYTKQFYGFEMTTGTVDHLLFVNSTLSNDAFVLDDMAFVTLSTGPVVPEPSTYAMGVLALLGLGSYGYRQRAWQR